MDAADGQPRDTPHHFPPRFMLGETAPVRLRDGVLFALLTEKVTVIDLSAYPDWVIVLATTLVAALAIWLLMKVLKLALWLLFFAVLVGGLAWVGWLLLK
ncbi:MAG: hypothetical protein Q7R41_15425 [Phycisphaerales bacterium]|nr:hypothetical protein [Phycisphaerales bacterium]